MSTSASPTTMTATEHPVDFCLHLAAQIRQRKKTLSYKPLSPSSATAWIASGGKAAIASPYGRVGDLLWMREPFGIRPGGAVDYPAARASTRQGGGFTAPAVRPLYRPADMTRAQASVILLIDSVSIVRLADDLTEDRALAAGMDPRGDRTHRAEFIAQWDEAYRGPQTFANNQPVWRLTFSIQAQASGQASGDDKAATR